MFRDNCKNWLNAILKNFSKKEEQIKPVHSTQLIDAERSAILSKINLMLEDIYNWEIYKNYFPSGHWLIFQYIPNPIVKLDCTYTYDDNDCFDYNVYFLTNEREFVKTYFPVNDNKFAKMIYDNYINKNENDNHKHQIEMYQKINNLLK